MGGRGEFEFSSSSSSIRYSTCARRGGKFEFSSSSSPVRVQFEFSSSSGSVRIQFQIYFLGGRGGVRVQFEFCWGTLCSLNNPYSSPVDNPLHNTPRKEFRLWLISCIG